MENKSFGQKFVISASEGIKGGLAILFVGFVLAIVIKYPGKLVDIAIVTFCCGLLPAAIICYFRQNVFHGPHLNGYTSKDGIPHGDQ